jgi:hypothetical protein
MFKQLENLIPKDGAIALTLSRTTDGNVRLTIVPVPGDGQEGKPRFSPLVFDHVKPEELDDPAIDLTPVQQAVTTITEAIAQAAKTTVEESKTSKKTITQTGKKTTIKYEPKAEPKPVTDKPPETPKETAAERKEREAREKAEAEAKAKAEAEQQAQQGVEDLKAKLAAAAELDLFAV